MKINEADLRRYQGAIVVNPKQEETLFELVKTDTTAFKKASETIILHEGRSLHNWEKYLTNCEVIEFGKAGMGMELRIEDTNVSDLERNFLKQVYEIWGQIRSIKYLGKTPEGQNENNIIN